MNESTGFDISFMRRHWDIKSESYDKNRDLSAPDAEILQTLKAFKPGLLLEIGFGPGIFAAELIKDFPAIKYHGTDISEKFIRTTRKKLAGDGFFTQADCRFLPYLNDSFDVVVEMDAIHHFPRKLMIKPICEISRILRPGGLAIIAEDWGKKPTDAGEQLAYKLQNQRFLNSSGLEYHPRDDEWQTMFEQCGLRMISLKHIPRPLDMRHFEKLTGEAAQKEVRQMRLLCRDRTPTTFMSIIVFNKK